MGMVIHDDMWEAAQTLPAKQRAPFLYALMEYRFEGVLPKGNPPWLGFFILCKDRMDMGAKASEKGRAMARARWSKEASPASTDSDAVANTAAYATADTQAYAQASNNSDAEVEVEVEVENNPLIPPFWLQCLDAFNHEFGSTYTRMPEPCQHNLERHKDQFTIEQVTQMLSYMHKERKGTKFQNTLTPNTLFSLDHFEQYMHMTQESAQKEDDYGIYDR